MKKLLGWLLFVVILFGAKHGYCVSGDRVHVLADDVARTTIAISSDGAVDVMSIVIKLRDPNVDSGIWYRLSQNSTVYLDNIKTSSNYNTNTHTLTIDYQVPHNSAYICNGVECVSYYFYIWYGDNVVGYWDEMRMDTGILLLK